MQVYSLKKPLEHTEWDIILGYARRVRALPRLGGSWGLSADCVEALSKPPAFTESIFPNLRIIGLYDPSATIAPLVRHLINPKVTKVLLHRTGILAAAIDAFGPGCPSVTDFHISEWDHHYTVSGLVCNWQNLCSVRCDSVNLKVDALLHLSRLRNLLSMSFQVHDVVVDRIYAAQSSTSTFTFSSLHDLRLNSPFLTPIARLLRYLRLPVIRGISVGLHMRPTPPDLMSFFVALQEACTHTSLNSLFLDAYQNGDESIISMTNSPPYYITFDRLRPLTVFVNIKSITLDIPCGVDLNERELLTLASSWPHLEEFEVCKDYDWATSSGITPEGFLQLLERCRSLRVLYFMFDTRGYTEIPQGHPWRGLTMPKHAFIHLLNSPIEEESIKALGVFFCVAPYPDFRLTTHRKSPYFRGSARPEELCDLDYDRWMKARELARYLWEERSALRRSLEAWSPQRCSQ